MGRTPIQAASSFAGGRNVAVVTAFPESPGSVRAVRVPTADDLGAAWQIVRVVLEPTPLVPSPIARDGSLKLETFQPTGSFKVRGGLAAVSALSPEIRVVTASAGNHGLGVAWAAARLRRQATVVVPEHSSPPKVAALRSLPVELVEHGSDYEMAEKYALELGSAEGTSFVSPYNDPHVIAGQATIGRELEAQAAAELTIVAPVGGGGLLSGLALWAQSRPEVHLAGVESSQSRSVSAAVAAGQVVRVPVGDTIADGLAANLEPGAITPGLLARAQLLAVDDDELRQAIRWLFTHHGLVVEGSGAAGVAAVLGGKVTVKGQLVVVVTGRNIAAERYANILLG
jgi:threonine dehydratase